MWYDLVHAFLSSLSSEVEYEAHPHIHIIYINSKCVGDYPVISKMEDSRSTGHTFAFYSSDHRLMLFSCFDGTYICYRCNGFLYRLHHGLWSRCQARHFWAKAGPGGSPVVAQQPSAPRHQPCSASAAHPSGSPPPPSAFCSVSAASGPRHVRGHCPTALLGVCCPAERISPPSALLGVCCLGGREACRVTSCMISSTLTSASSRS